MLNRIAVLLTFLIFMGDVNLPAAGDAAKYQQYGTAYYKAGKYKEALQYYEAAYKINPDPQLGKMVQGLRAYLTRQAGTQAPAAGNPAPGANSAVTASSNGAALAWGGWGLDVDLLGTYSMMSVQDAKTNAATKNKMYQANPTITASASADGNALGYQARLHLSSPWKLGLGLGYAGSSATIGTFKATQDLGGGSSISIDDKATLNLSNLPITLTYNFAFTPNLSLESGFGMDMLNASMVDEITTTGTGIFAMTQVSKGTFNSSSMGFHVTANAHYKIFNHVRLYGGLEYLMGSLTKFSGTQSITATIGGSSSTITSDPMYITMKTDTTYGEYGSTIATSAALDASVKERYMVMDVSGLRMNLGVRVEFP